MRTIDDPEFGRTLTLAEAYRVFERFVNDYVVRGDTETVLFLQYISLAGDGGANDPAALDDYLSAVHEVLGS